MVNTQELKTMEYIKQLEKDNFLLRQKLCKLIQDFNTANLKSNLIINSYKKALVQEKHRNALVKLGLQ